MFVALDEARATTTTASGLVRLSDAMRRCLRDLGVFDDAYVPPSYGDDGKDPSRLLFNPPDPRQYLT
jgi:hypothetical protein